MMRMLWVLTALMLAQAAPGQSSEQRNAATWYGRAYQRFQDTPISESEWEAVWAFEANPSRGPSPMVRSVLIRLQPALNLTRRGAHQPASDFDIDIRNGPGHVPEHLNPARQLAKLLRTDFLMRLTDADSQGAADRLAVMYRLANHIGEDRTVISSLVSSAILALAEHQFDLALDHAAVGQTEANVLMRAVSLLDEDDPGHYQDALVDDSLATVHWIMQEYAGEDGIQRLIEDAQEGFGDDPETQAQLAALTEQELQSALRESDRALAVVIEAFGNADQEKARHDLAAIESAIETGEHGVAARTLVPSASKLYDAMMRSRQEVILRKRTLQGIIDGTIDPKANANAAVWYMRAIVAMEQVDRKKLAAMREYAADHDEAASADLAETLDRMQPIIDTLRDASHMKRCDFEYAKGGWPTVLRHYQPGMRDAMRLMHADAARQIHAQDYQAASDRLVIAYRMCAHLSSDKELGSSLVAHVGFKHTDALVGAAMEGRLFNEDQLKDLGRAMSRNEGGDAFGYRAAIDVVRDRLRPWIALGGDDATLAAQAEEFLKQRDADSLLALNAAYDAIVSFGADKHRNLAEESRLMDDVMALDALRDSILQADVIKGLVEQSQFEALQAIEHPMIGQIQQRQSEAATDLRNAHSRMRIRLGRMPEEASGEETPKTSANEP